MLQLCLYENTMLNFTYHSKILVRYASPINLRVCCQTKAADIVAYNRLALWNACVYFSVFITSSVGSNDRGDTQEMQTS